LNINVSTGDITPFGSTPGNYTVIYTIPFSISGCPPATATRQVTITATPVVPTITYSGSPFCTSLLSAQPVTQTGATGGTYSSSPSGLSINATTGAITPSTSTAGNYTVTYTVAASGGCAAVSTTTSVTITGNPTATINYTGSPWCTTAAVQSVILTGTFGYTGGTYSSTTGLSIDASTGAITPSTSTAGIYTVTYTVAASGGCATVTATKSVTITLAPVAPSISYTGSPWCTTEPAQPVTQTGSSGGTYSSSPGGLIINASSGAITPSTSTAGNYTVTYTVAASGGCAAVSTTTSVTITGNPTATINYTGSPWCTTAAVQSVSLTGTFGYTGGTYSSTTGLSIDASTGAITPSTSTGGTYTVIYTLAASGGCATVTATKSVTITLAPVVPTISYIGSPWCTTAPVQPVTQTGQTGGIYSSALGLSVSAITGAITPSTSTAGNYTVLYAIAASGGCAAVSSTIPVTITAVPVTPVITYPGSPFCTSLSSTQPVTLIGPTGGIYSSSPSPGLSINVNTGGITPIASTAGTYLVTYTVAASGGCLAVDATRSVTITEAPVSPTISYSDVAFCKTASDQSVTQIGEPGGIYSFTPAGLSCNPSTGLISPSSSAAGTYTITYTVAASLGCAAVSGTRVITITALPVVILSPSPSAPFCVSETGTLSLIGSSTSGYYTSTPAGLQINASTGVINPGSNQGTYTIAYTIPASGGCPEVSDTTLVTILQNPLAAINVVGTTSPCSGDIPLTSLQTTLYFGETISWRRGGIPISPSETNSSLNVTQTGSYDAIITNAVGCFTTSNAIAVTLNPVPPTYTPAGANSFCIGEFSTLSVPPISGYNYQWYLGGAQISGATSNSYNSISTSGTYNVEVTIASSGCNVFSNDVIVTGYDKPTIPTFTNASPSVICSPNSVTLETNLISTSYPGSPSASYLWSGGNSSTTNSATYSTTGNYTATHRLTYPTSPNLTCTSSQNHQVTINPLPTAPTIAGVTSFCIGSSTTLSVAFNAAYTYQWFLNDIPTGPASNTYSGIASAGTYKVRVTDIITGCSIFSNSVTVTSTNLPIAVISASPSVNPVCLNSGGLVTLTSSSSAGNTWSTCSGNLSTQSISVSSSCNIILTVTSGGCTSLPVSYNLIINQNPTANISPTGPHTICQGGSVTLSVTPTPPSGTTTNWYKLPDITNPVFLNSSTYAANTTGNYYCIVTNNTTNCSFTSPTQVVNVTIPGTASISYPNTSYCTTSTPQAVTLIGTPGGTYSVFPIIGLLVSSSTGTITIAGATPGSYTITYTLPASGGCPAVTASANVTITANTIPLFTAVGPYCSGAIIPQLPNPSLNGIIGTWSPAINNTTTTLYTFTPTAGLGQCASPVNTTIAITSPPTITEISYSSPSYCTSTTTTQVPFGVTPGGVFSVNSTGLNAWNSATGSFVPSGSIPGVYTISYTIGSASSTCGSVFVQAIVTITQAAAAPTISYPFSAYCKSETAQQLPSITGSGGIISVSPSSGLSINSSGIITPSLSAIGIYTITYTIPASAGCLSQIANTTITIKPIPTAPTITYSTPLIFCDGGSVILSIIPIIGHTYKWWKIGDQTFSGTGTSFAASTTGSYYVEITSISTNCSDESLPVDVTVKPLPNAIISPTGPLAICAGTSTTLTAFNAAGYSFSWGASHIYQVSTAGTYNVTVSLNGCSALSNDVVVSVIPNPLPGITSSPINLQACFGQAVTLLVNNITPLSDYTFQWFSASGPSVLGTLSSYSATTSGNYYIRVTSATGSFCTAESAEVAVTIHPNIPVSIIIPPNSSTSFCEGTSSITLTASPIIGHTHVWSNGQTSSTINLSLASQSNPYTVTVTNTVTNCSATSAPMPITIYPNPSAPSISPIGPLNSCAGNPLLTLTASPSTFPTYQWKNGNVNVGSNSPSHNPASTGTYSVIATNSNGCSSLPSNSTSITIVPIPATPVIIPQTGSPLQFCQGLSINLSATINSGSTYQWFRNGIPYISGNPVNITLSGTYTLIETNSLGCSSQTSSPLTIIVYPNPTPVITALSTTEFCADPGASVTLQATPGFNSYQWTCVSPTLPTQAASSSPNFIATQSGTYTVTTTNSNGCISAVSNSIPVVVNPLPLASITNGSATTFCADPGAFVTLTAGPSGNIYQWSTSGPALGNPSLASQNITQTGMYSVLVTNPITNCENTASLPVTVNPLPTPSIIASGITTPLCDGQSVVLTADPTGSGLTYIWSPSSFTSIATPPITSSGTYSVKITDANGCSATSAPVPVVFNSNPIAFITPSSLPTFCQGETITLQSNPMSDNYVWSQQLSPGVYTITASGIPSIPVSQSGIYTVTNYNPSGCFTTSNPITVTVNPLPTPLITAIGAGILGNTEVCQGNSVFLSVSGIGITSYQWRVNGVNIPGANSINYPATSSGFYSVEVGNNNNCFKISSEVEVTINPNPTAEINYLNSPDPILLCPGGTIGLTAAPSSMYYSWNSPNLGFETNQFVLATTSGTYEVIVTDPATGCFDTSDPVNVTIQTLGTTSAAVIGMPSTLTLCPGSLFTLSGITSNATSFNWTLISAPAGCNLIGANTLNPTFTSGSVSGTAILRLNTSLNYACNTDSSYQDITINISPSIPTLSNNINSGLVDQVLCSNIPIDPIIFNVLDILGSGTTIPSVTINGTTVLASTPYNGISWNFIGGQVVISGTPNFGTYTYTVNGIPTGSPSCLLTSLSGTITSQAPSLSIFSGQFTNNQIICIGTSIAPIIYDYTGIISSIDLPDGVFAQSNTSGNQYTISGTPLAVGYYNYVITTETVCGFETLLGEITVIPPITGNTSGTATTTNCDGSEFTLIGGILNSSANTNYTYLWVYSTSITGPYDPAPGINTNANYEGTIYLANDTLYFRRFVYAGDCYDYAAPVMVHVIPLGTNPNMIAFAGADQTISLGQSVELVTTGVNISEYNWSPTIGLSSATISNPFASPVSTTIYTLTVQDIYGCSYSDDITVTVLNDYSLTIPSLITPNDDGSNDFWEIPESLFYTGTTVKIINREGQEVYSSSNYDNTWDGTFNGKLLPEATYYYFIQFPNSEITHKGPVTILRNIK
jgi:gliding motility-associated-like protein